MDNKLFVGNLSFNTTEDQLRTLFAGAGTVSSVTIIKDRFSGTSKGFAFVEMASQNDAENAIRMFNNASLDNRNLKVDKARPQEDRSSGGGFRSGGGNFGGGNRRGGSGGSGGGRRY